MPFASFVTESVEQTWDKLWERQTVEGELYAVRSFPILTRILQGCVRGYTSIAEAGCGLGRYLLYFREHGYSIHGIDLSAEGLRKIHQFDMSVPIVQGDVQRMPYMDKSLDLYVSIGVLEHFIQGPQVALKETRRVLRDEGRLVLSGPFFHLNLPGRIKRLVRKLLEIVRWFLEKRESPPHFWEYHYHPEEMVEHLVIAGFSVEQVYMYGFRAVLWSDFPFLRHPASKNHRGYFTVARTPGVEPLNRMGCLLEVLAERVFPMQLALGWVIVAKPVGSASNTGPTFRTLPQDEGMGFPNGPKMLLTRLDPEAVGDRIPCYVNNWRTHVERFIQPEAEWPRDWT